MLNRLLATVSIGFLVFASTSASSMATEDLLRLIGFGGVCADCDLSGKDLSGVSMRGASFPRANFTGANLTNAKISGANFGRAIFKRADLSEAILEASNFGRSDLTGAKMDDVKASGITLAYAVLNGVQAEDAEFIGSNLAHASLVGAKLSDVTFDNSNLGYADLSGAKLPDASLRGVSLVKARFDGAILTGVDFKGANLTNVEFGNANIDGASFKQAILNGADLSKVKRLRQRQLDNACGNDKTTLPKGRTLSSCAEVEWANASLRDDETGLNYSFNFRMTAQDRESMRKATRKAVKESGFALQKARIALVEALNNGDFPKVIIERGGQRFSWPGYEDVRSEELRRIDRALDTLDGLKLDNRRAQRALDAAIRDLEKAQSTLQDSDKEQELAGGKE